MRITHFERLPSSGVYSIEKLFKTIRSAFPADYCIRVVRCPTPAHSLFWLPWGIAKAFRTQGDVNHIAGDIHYVALALRGSKTILTIHDVNRLLQLKGVRKAIYKWLYFYWPMRRCRFVTTISSHTRSQLIQTFPFISQNIEVIPNCITAGFEPRPCTFNSTNPRILQIGTAANKNLDRVIEAVSGRPCVLHIIGPLSDKHRGTLQRAGIVYENAVDISDAALIHAYENADLVIFVSLAEGFGMPVIEAQSIGRPVITSRLSPMQEVAGDGALLVDPHNVEAIRGAIDKITQDADCRQSLIEAGFKNVQRFQPSSVAAQYAELYRRVADGMETSTRPAPSLP